MTISAMRIVLTLLFFPAFVLLVRGFGSRAKAFRGIVAIIGLVVAGTVITNPRMLDEVALLAGINSTVELVLYLVVLTLVTLTAYMVAKFRYLEMRLSRLVQKLALSETDIMIEPQMQARGKPVDNDLR